MGVGSVLQQREWPDAVITFLETACSSPGAPHRFYDEDDEPGLAAADLAAGYGIVYTVEGGGFTGPGLWAPESRGSLVVQVTSVGLTRAQVQWLSDRVRLSFLARVTAGGYAVPFIAPAGWTVSLREPDADGLPPVIPEGPAKGKTYSVPERFRLSIEPTNP